MKKMFVKTSHIHIYLPPTFNPMLQVVGSDWFGLTENINHAKYNYMNKNWTRFFFSFCHDFWMKFWNRYLSKAAAENWVWRFILFVLLTIKKFNCIFVVAIVILTKCYLYLAQSVAYRFGTVLWCWNREKIKFKISVKTDSITSL